MIWKGTESREIGFKSGDLEKNDFFDSTALSERDGSGSAI
jgi:hypothetical protein